MKNTASTFAALIVLTLFALAAACYMSGCAGVRVTGKICHTLPDGTTVCASSSDGKTVVLEATK